VKVTESFDETVRDCDAIMLEINDPGRHLEYFTRCAGLGKPVFLDKPLADTIANGEQILALARQHGTKFFSASSLRFVPQLGEACLKVEKPAAATVYGPLGKAPSGSSIVWYGVHAFEMLERAMGTGARSVRTRADTLGVVCIIDYDGGRRGLVELIQGAWIYGGTLRTREVAAPFVVDTGHAYADLLTKISEFFRSGQQPVAVEATRETMAMLDAADRSLTNGRAEPIGP